MTSTSRFKSLRKLVAGVGRRPIRNMARLRLEALVERITPSTSPAAAYGNLPLASEQNQGQAGPSVDFLARGSGYTVALTPSEAVLSLQNGAGGDVLHFQLAGSNPSAEAAGQDELITKTNYLIGSDPSQWHTNIANYGRVTYQSAYPGVDLVYYGNQRQLEYDFVVAPGADPGVIQLSIRGAKGLTLDASGNLVVHTSGSDLVQQAPVVYQSIGKLRRAVSGQFVLEGNNQVGFRLGAYDTSRPLVIDPVLSYSTYLGGNGEDQAEAIAVDAAGNAYLTGTTYSTNFPTTAGAVQGAKGGGSDVFVAKLNASGTGLLYATYLGGAWGEQGNGIAVDSDGNAYVTGGTLSGNFPVTAGAFDTTNTAGYYKGFVAKLNSAGSALVYSTYLGGTGGSDEARAIAIDASGNAYVTGLTSSGDFPTQNAVQPSHADDFYGSTSGYIDAFVTKLNSTGTGLVYSTFLGGTGNDRGDGIAVDTTGNAYVTGFTEATQPTNPNWGIIAFPTTAGAFQPTNASSSSVPFVTKLNADGSALAYSTYLGGTNGYADWAAAVAVDSAGDAYVTGTTQASDFPTTVGAFDRTYGGGIDAFVSELNPAGSALVYSTFLGGSNTDQPLGIAVDGAGNASVVGITGSTNFPAANALQPNLGGGYDAFVTRLNATGSGLIYSTYLGGSGNDYGLGIALDSSGSAFVVGGTSSANFPTSAGGPQGTYGGGEDAFVAKIDPTTSPSFAVSGFPSPVTAGVAGSFTVTAEDVNGAADPSYMGTVHFTSSDPQAVLPADYTFTALDAGTHTFSGTLKTAGSQSIEVTDTSTGNMTGRQSGITVQAAALSAIAVTGFPSPTIAGVAHTFTVAAKDAYGNTVAGYLGTVHCTSSDAQAVLPSNYKFKSADAGVHTFSATLKTAGLRSLTATDTQLSSLTGSQSGIAVNSAAASKVLISGPGTVSAGVAFSLTVTFTDAYGNVATGYSGTVHFTSTDSTATLPSNYTFTPADQGTHTFTGVVLRKKGNQKVTISDTLNTSLTASLTEKVI